jgi:biotin operon repressor
MGDSNRGPDAERVLDVLAAAPSGPYSTGEVADALGCPRRRTHETLQRLADEGRVRTRTVGTNARLWWLPAATAEREPERAPLPELTDEHVLRLTFRSGALGEAFLAVSPEIEMRLDGVVELEDGTVLQYLTISGAPPREVFSTLESYPHIIDLRLISRHDDEFRIEGHATADSMGKLFREFGGTTRTAYIEDGAFVIVGKVPATSDVPALAERATTFYPDIELVGVRLEYTPRLFRSVVEDRLTDRQWTSMNVAYYGGYFEPSRESSGDELAARLGITRQTFHHHLRNVQRTVFQVLLEGFDAS